METTTTNTNMENPRRGVDEINLLPARFVIWRFVRDAASMGNHRTRVFVVVLNQTRVTMASASFIAVFSVFSFFAGCFLSNVSSKAD